MQRHHRDRDMLWLTSGQPFLSWAADLAADQRATPRDTCRRRDPEPAGAMKPAGPKALH